MNKGILRHLANQGLMSLLIVLLMISGTAISLGAFKWLKTMHTRVITNAFYTNASERIGAIEAAFHRIQSPLVASAAFLHTNDSINQEKFAYFTASLLTQYPGVSALSMVPRVTLPGLTAYQNKASRETPGFHIMERDAQGRMVPVTERSEYFPVRYIEPLKGNEPAVGFDLASQPDRRLALQFARDSGKLTATARIRLVQEKATEAYSFLLIQPLFAQHTGLDSAAKQPAPLNGYVTGVVRAKDLVENSLEILEPGGIDIAVLDNQAEQGKQLLYFHSSRQRTQQIQHANQESRSSAGLRHELVFSAAGREWSVLATPVPGFYTVNTPAIAWGVLTVGLIVTVLLAGYLQILRSNARQLADDRDTLEKRVRKRTTELEKLHKELIRQERLAALGQLTGSVAHELRNPLGTVLISLEMLKKKKSEEDRKRILDRALSNLHRCSRIVSEMLDFARARGPASKPVRLNDWLNTELEQLDVPGGVKFTKHLPEKNIVVDFDPELMSRALVNVLNNAFQAVKETKSDGREKTVTLSCTSYETEVCLEVHDNGPGITASDLSQVCEPLFSTKSFGVGFGLSIVKRVMEQHDGSFQLTSTPGQGTRARMCLKKTGL